MKTFIDPCSMPFSICPKCGQKAKRKKSSLLAELFGLNKVIQPAVATYKCCNCGCIFTVRREKK